MTNVEKNANPHKLVSRANGVSLEEINGTVEVPKGKSFWHTLLAYSGPGALVAVGYMDPGNWSTSITGGQNFQYMLMSIILISSLVAMLLQYMAAKLGIVTQLDLAQAIRERTGKGLGIVLWIMTELAIMATDIAEVIGAAIALYLLFDIPLIIAVFITVVDVFVLLLLMKVGFRKIEGIVVALILVILFVFTYQVILSNPNWGDVFKGFVPTGETFSTHHAVNGMTPLSGSLGIIGATVMPHNFYLHSAISQTRKIDHNNEQEVTNAVRFTTWDSNIQLSAAFIVNCLLLIVGVAVFKSGTVQDPSFFGLYDALSDPSKLGNGVLASIARSGILSTLFAVALLASGQNSTITGTLTGQVIMEGFIHMRMPLWARRLVTRLLSVAPVLIAVSLTKGQSDIQQHEALNRLMNDSQIFLSFALPFSMLPLLVMTNSKNTMGKFKNGFWIQFFGWISVIGLIFLNLRGLPDAVLDFFGSNPSANEINLANWIAYTLIIAILILLFWTTYEVAKKDKEIAKKHQSQKA
ncbi:Nramp family divalent metal transporter [Ligilactobacillus equi]|nr:Nramp family divalent metal transporter [Ligilactobacillus equi]MCQ2556602.1 Nramp family divalent metal transporter [Ligilactobacillus sp.]